LKNSVRNIPEPIFPGQKKMIISPNRTTETAFPLRILPRLREEQSENWDRQIMLISARDVIVAVRHSLLPLPVSPVWQTNYKQSGVGIEVQRVQPCRPRRRCNLINSCRFLQHLAGGIRDVLNFLVPMWSVRTRKS